MKKTLYTVLGVAPDATETDIAEAYARFQAGNHPDSFDRNAQIMAKEAFATLSNPAKRSLYDMSLVAPPRALTQAVVDDEPGFIFDWRHGLAIAVAVGVLSGWWFGRAKPVPAGQRIDNPQADMVLARPARGTEFNSRTEPAAIASAATGAQLSSEELFAKLAPSVVRINVSGGAGQQDALGSGVVIGPGTVITNCHVAEAGNKLQVKSGDQVYEARLDLADQAHDLCRLDVPNLRADNVRISPSKGLRTGQKVIAIGAPHGLDLTMSEGIVSSLRQVDDGTLIQTTAPISPGSSGGGLFDAQGNLVGIVTFQSKTGQNLNFAAPSEWIGSMSQTKGNGIIGKLTGNKPVGESEVADERADNTEMLARRWNCRDSIDGFTFQLNLNARGHVEMRKDNSVMQGIWRFVGKKIEIVPYSGTIAFVEYLNEEKLILNFGKGVRAVCAP